MNKGSNIKGDKALGEILVEKNIISRSHLDLALKRQKQEKGKYLGQILFEMGIPQDKINKALDIFNKRKPIGQILVDMAVISEKQLGEALDKQKQLRKRGERKPLGMLLVEMGYTTYHDYLNALSRHLNIPIISMREFSASSSLQKAVGEKYAEQNKIVVLEDSSAKIKLAMAEPSAYIMDELQRILSTSKPVEFYLASPIEIESALKKSYDPFSLSGYR